MALVILREAALLGLTVMVIVAYVLASLAAEKGDRR